MQVSSCCEDVTVWRWSPSEKLQVDSLSASTRISPSCCAFKSAASRDVYLHNEDGASIFAERRNCMMRSCACLLGKEALAYIITHSLPFGGSSPHRRHHHHLSQPVPPSCTSFCLDLQDDPHNNGVPSCSRSLSAQQTPAWAPLGWASQTYDNPFLFSWFIYFF